MNEIYLRFFRHLINVDGLLTNEYALSVFNSEINSSYFNIYDSKNSRFFTGPFSILWSLLTEYFDTYRTLPSDSILGLTVESKQDLNAQQKRDILSIANDLRHVSVEPGQFDYLIQRVKDNYLKNHQVAICTRGVELSTTDANKSAEYILSELSALLAKTNAKNSDESRSKFTWQLMESQLRKFKEHGTLMSGAISYGFDEWDNNLGGMYPGELIVFCGPPGTGKSFICESIAYSAAESGNLVVIANREMLDSQVTSRFVSYKTKIPSRKLRVPEAMTAEEKAMVEAAMEEFVTLQDSSILFIPPEKCVNVAMIKREIELALGSKKPDLIIVDYLNDLESDSGRLDGHEKIGNITQALKNLAVYNECPLATPTQPSSEGLKSTNPGMKDVGYKVINQKADTIFYCLEDEENKYIAPILDTGVGTPGIINVKVIKARNDAKPLYPFRLSVDFTTASIYQVERGASDSGILSTLAEYE